ISEVGPKGSFLSKRHTVRNIRKELWFPTLLDRDNYDNWLKSGSPDMEKRCRDRKEELLRKHEPIPLEDDVKNDLEKIIESAKRNLSKQH
ncbi:MAG: trimethylamine methyltransferase family protein, partial [Candidatus Lokiarchaeota archaeon]|nr:trimethylamine methyltransferase family protein [Candidatus Lokiarchaeota archaeon]